MFPTLSKVVHCNPTTSHIKCGVECGVTNLKPKGRHPDKVLSATKVRGVKEPGRYADGNGLYLVVDPSGAKRWMLRTVVHGKRRDIGLGGTKVVSLAEAREKATEYRKIARDGGDPIAIKRRAGKTVPTFKEAAEKVHEGHSKAWKNPKHSAQWINTLVNYAHPHIGDTRIDRIDTPDVMSVLLPIWLDKPETARRVRQRIKTVLDWATASGFRTGENPVDGVSKGLPNQPERVSHHAAMPYGEIPDFILKLRNGVAGPFTKLGLEFLTLTATRTSEVINADWSEIDIENRAWTIPAERMKANRVHRVPLSDRAIEILATVKKLTDGKGFIFQGRSIGRPLSNMAFLKLLKSMDDTLTVHGFRSSFRDWASERTNFPREVCEMALAHSIKDKSEAAYRRGDLFEKRRDLMASWGAFLAGSSADVVSLRAG